MGCGCKKREPIVVTPLPKYEDIQVVNVTIVPETPEQQHSNDLNNWNGGPAINENKTDDNG